MDLGLFHAPQRENYYWEIVFLSTPSGKYTPHMVHCLNVLDGLVLVLVCEVPKCRYAGAISQTISVLRAILSSTRQQSAQGHYVINVVDNNLQRLHDSLKKVKDYDHKLNEISEKWDLVKKQGLLSFLKQHSSKEIPQKVESLLTSMQEALKGIFYKLYLSQSFSPSESVIKGIDKVQKLIQTQLSPYKDYLIVKAKRNIAMTGYIQDFPGLVHFIYIDRVSHHMTAPSMNIIEDPESEQDQLTVLIKQKIWDIIPRLQCKLHEGFFNQMIREGDFHFSYFLWFEDANGGPIQVQEPYQSCADNIQPGLLAGNFYRQLLKQCFPKRQPHSINCYELILVHTAMVSSKYVLNHANRLAIALWEASSPVHSPISLL